MQAVQAVAVQVVPGAAAQEVPGAAVQAAPVAAVGKADREGKVPAQVVLVGWVAPAV